jgi:aminoglycoside phosphotransferase (APT) family kinase protein
VRWCEWVDHVLGTTPATLPPVLVHGDLHGHNQVWDRALVSLLAVVDFEESGVADPNCDLRYLPGNADGPALALAVLKAYERLSGRRLAVDRVMARHALTALGDALWRTEAGVALPGGGNPATYVDRPSATLAALDLA